MRITLMLLLVLSSTAVLAQDCTIGNDESVYAYDAGRIGGPALYAQFVDPMSGGCDCTPGFAIDTISITLYMDVGATVDVRGLLYDVVDDGGCMSPGPGFDVSATVSLDGITTPGYYEVFIPSPFVCALMTEPFFLGVEIVAFAGGVELPYVDENTGIPKRVSSGLCTTYADTGSGWEDLYAAAYPGGLPISASASCCFEPIDRETDTWGEVKSLYR